MKNIAKKVQDKTEQKVEEKIVDETMKAIDAAFETKDADSASQGNDMGLFLNKMGISSDPVPIQDIYAFNQKIHMSFNSFDKNGEKTDEGEMITYLNTNTKCIAYEVVSGDMAQAGQNRFIVDAENGAIILLGEEDNEKKGLVYGMNAYLEHSDPMDEEEDLDLSDSPENFLANPHVSKTGRTKTIAGYKCDEYTYKDESVEASYWITNDLKLNSRDYFSTLVKTSLAAQGMAWGYMLEATSVNKDSGERSTMKVLEVDTESISKLSLKDYEIVNFGNLNFPAED